MSREGHEREPRERAGDRPDSEIAPLFNAEGRRGSLGHGRAAIQCARAAPPKPREPRARKPRFLRARDTGGPSRGALSRQEGEEGNKGQKDYPNRRCLAPPPHSMRTQSKTL